MTLFTNLRFNRFIAAGLVAVLVLALGLSSYVMLDSSNKDEQEFKLPPAGVDVRVGDFLIRNDDTFRWLQAAANSQAPNTTSVAVPDAPLFESCIADGLAQAKAAGASASSSSLKDQCQESYDAMREEALRFLVNARWIVLAAEQAGITVSDSDVEGEFDTQRKALFSSDSEYQEYLSQSRLTQDDLRYRARIGLLSQKLQEQILADLGPVTAAQVKEEYNQRGPVYNVSEKRDVQYMLLSSQSDAKKAVTDIKAGQTFTQVGAKYQAQGRLLKGIDQDSFDTAIGTQVFAAKKSAVSSPIETEEGFVIFKVVGIIPGRERNFEQAKADVKSSLTAQRQEQAQQQASQSWESKYKPQTVCAPTAIFDFCANYTG